MAGRKTKLNSARQCAICEVMKHGGTFRAAAAAAGICESTLHDWRKYGDDDEAGVYGRFVAALERALGEGESAAVGAVYRAFTECSVETVEETLPNGDSRTKTITRPPDPSFALRWLERRRPSQWNIPHRLAVGQDPDAEPVVVFYLPHNERDIAAIETAGGGPFDAQGRQDPA